MTKITNLYKKSDHGSERLKKSDRASGRSKKVMIDGGSKRKPRSKRRRISSSSSSSSSSSNSSGSSSSSSSSSSSCESDGEVFKTTKEEEKKSDNEEEEEGEITTSSISSDDEEKQEETKKTKENDVAVKNDANKNMMIELKREKLKQKLEEIDSELFLIHEEKQKLLLQPPPASPSPSYASSLSSRSPSPPPIPKNPRVFSPIVPPLTPPLSTSPPPPTPPPALPPTTTPIKTWCLESEKSAQTNMLNQIVKNYREVIDVRFGPNLFPKIVLEKRPGVDLDLRRLPNLPSHPLFGENLGRMSAITHSMQRKTFLIDVKLVMPMLRILYKFMKHAFTQEDFFVKPMPIDTTVQLWDGIIKRANQQCETHCAINGGIPWLSKNPKYTAKYKKHQSGNYQQSTSYYRPHHSHSYGFNSYPPRGRGSKHQQKRGGGGGGGGGYYHNRRLQHYSPHRSHHPHYKYQKYGKRSPSPSSSPLQKLPAYDTYTSYTSASASTPPPPPPSSSGGNSSSSTRKQQQHHYGERNWNYVQS